MRAVEGLMQNSTTVPVGTARVSILNAGDMRTQLSRELAVPEALWRPQHAERFERVGVSPSLSILIEHAGAHVLVDINDYRATMTPDSPYAIAGYTPPPDIPTQLASLGVQPEDVTHVVITHAHWDHFAGVTSPADGKYVPTFPRARYYLGAADWHDAELQTALRDPASLEARTLGILRERGLLHLIEQREPIAESIDILPAPGETPGHQIVRVQSGGESLYVIGDLVHDAIEVEHPDWMVSWADAETMRTTRHWVFAEAHAAQATLVAAHIAGFGRIERAGDALRWIGA
jgi:glyoxylase-like metal-dependent hydrolase (beta-lactamase superfamily II)